MTLDPAVARTRMSNPAGITAAWRGVRWCGGGEAQGRALLGRDRTVKDDLFRASLHDCLIITMKGISAGAACCSAIASVAGACLRASLSRVHDQGAGLHAACATRCRCHPDLRFDMVSCAGMQNTG